MAAKCMYYYPFPLIGQFSEQLAECKADVAAAPMF